MYKLQKLSVIDLFTAQTKGIELYRIPVIVVSANDTILTFVEARNDQSDFAASKLIMRRSLDNGESWEQEKILLQSNSEAVHNAVAIVDFVHSNAEKSIIHLLFCKGYKRAFYCRSEDDGETFSTPVEITYVFNSLKNIYPHGASAIGCGHSIQLQRGDNRGRLIAPVWMGKIHSFHRPSKIAMIYSDDYGKSWQHGPLIPGKLQNPSESQAVQLQDSSVYLSIRHESKVNRKAFSTSPNGVDNWGEMQIVPELLEPVCFGSIARFDKSGLIFANPDSVEGRRSFYTHKCRRQKLSVKISEDEGKTWGNTILMEEGPSGYSDLAVDSKQNIFLFYERGFLEDNWEKANVNRHLHQFLSVAKFRLEKEK